jgi:hypothetical protein
MCPVHRSLNREAGPRDDALSMRVRELSSFSLANGRALAYVSRGILPTANKIS